MRYFYVLIFCCSGFLVAKPFVFYQTQEKNYCIWSIIDISSKQSTQIQQTPLECPNHIWWDEKNKKTYYQQNNTLFSFAWGENKTLNLEEQMNYAEKDVWPQDFWFDEQTQNMKHAYYIPLKPNNLTLTTTLPKDPKNPFEIYSVVYQNKTLQSDSVSISFGVPYLAVMMEKTGQWQKTQVKLTSTEACDTLGMSVFSNYLNTPKYFKKLSHFMEKEQFDCMSLNSDCFKNHFNATTQSKIYSHLKNPTDSYILNYLKTDDSSGLIYNVNFIDGQGPVSAFASPMFWCKDNCSTLKKLNLENLSAENSENQTVHLLPHQNFILIHTYGEAPVAYLLPEEKPILILPEQAQNVSWFNINDFPEL